MFGQHLPSYDIHPVELLCPLDLLKILPSTNHILQIFSSPGYAFPFSLRVHYMLWFPDYCS